MLLGDAEIEKLARPIDFEIRRFDVMVDDRWILTVQVLERIQQLIRTVQHHSHIKRLPGAHHNGLEIVAGDQLHHQIVIAALAKIVGHPG